MDESTGNRIDEEEFERLVSAISNAPDDDLSDLDTDTIRKVVGGVIDGIEDYTNQEISTVTAGQYGGTKFDWP